ncbi:Uncharacterised protein [Chlamydia trachomatis]|nr:Uncharacterised protein [Chlamydia trachomatis]
MQPSGEVLHVRVAVRARQGLTLLVFPRYHPRAVTKPYPVSVLGIHRSSHTLFL